MDLQELRQQIDRIDDQLVHLFVQRMALSAQVADYKKAHRLPVLVPAREQEKLADVADKAGADMAGYAKELYVAIFELSREYQIALLAEDRP